MVTKSSVFSLSLITRNAQKSIDKICPSQPITLSLKSTKDSSQFAPNKIIHTLYYDKTMAQYLHVNQTTSISCSLSISNPYKTYSTASSLSLICSESVKIQYTPSEHNKSQPAAGYLRFLPHHSQNNGMCVKLKSLKP